MRVLVVFGTRPEAIKCFPVIKELNKFTGVEVVTCSTGQHRDILDQVVNLIGFKPDKDLGLMRKKPKLSEIVTDVLQAMERVVGDVQPDRILVPDYPCSSTVWPRV
jgi:UDP-N-acetylglucosamine 2-epimerase